MISQGVPISASSISNPLFRTFYTARNRILSYMMWKYDEKGIVEFQKLLNDRTSRFPL